MRSQGLRPPGETCQQSALHLAVSSAENSFKPHQGLEASFTSTGSTFGEGSTLHDSSHTVRSVSRFDSGIDCKGLPRVNLVTPLKQGL
jgi:hypothetical protein